MTQVVTAHGEQDPASSSTFQDFDLVAPPCFLPQSLI